MFLLFLMIIILYKHVLTVFGYHLDDKLRLLILSSFQSEIAKGPNLHICQMRGLRNTCFQTLYNPSFCVTEDVDVWNKCSYIDYPWYDPKIINGDLFRNFLDIFKTTESQIFLLELLLCEILLLNIF